MNADQKSEPENAPAEPSEAGSVQRMVSLLARWRVRLTEQTEQLRKAVDEGDATQINILNARSSQLCHAILELETEVWAGKKANDELSEQPPIKL